jgi:hypothetical protein
LAIRVYPFHLDDEDSLITVDCHVGFDTYTMALDTGASHTVIDLSVLLIAGYEIKDSLEIVELETA